MVRGRDEKFFVLDLIALEAVLKPKYNQVQRKMVVGGDWKDKAIPD